MLVLLLTLVAQASMFDLPEGVWQDGPHDPCRLEVGTPESRLFRLTYGPSIKVFVRVLGRRITLRVDSRIIAEIDDSSFTQGVYFKVSAMSLTFELGAFTVAVPFRDVADLAKAFADFAEDEVVDRLKEWLAGPFADAYDWVKYNVTAVAEEAAKFFEDVGAAPGQIAKGLAAAFELDPGDAVAMLSVPMDEAKKILEDGFDWTSDQVDDWAKTVGGGFVGFVKGIF